MIYLHEKKKKTSFFVKFTSEDPTFSFNTSPHSGQIVLSGMGELHLWDLLKVTIKQKIAQLKYEIRFELFYLRIPT
ncbi:MAG: hypothetical protein ACTS4Y_01980 [Candidatus Hodgkinia cicadicola]